MSELLLDMDGVVCDFMSEMYKQVYTETGEQLCHYDTQDYWFNDSPHKALFLDIMHRPGVYRHLDVITGAVQAVNRLRERYDVRVCSSPVNNGSCEDEKREWLSEHFDTDFAEQAIMTRNKELVKGKAIIEDNPHIKVPYEVIMFDQPWNRKSIFKHHMFNWGDLGVVERVMK